MVISNHILFPGQGGKAGIDLDVQHDMLNGKTSDQLKAAAATQIKDYVAAAVADPTVTDGQGRPLTPEAQAQTNRLVSALVDGDVRALSKAGQEIMQNTQTAKSINQVLERIETPSSIQFDGLDTGSPSMTINDGGPSAIVIPKSGEAHAYRADYMGKPTNIPADLQATIKEDQEQTRWNYAQQIESSQTFLNMVERMPADGYSNMKNLESSYTKKLSPADEEKVKAHFEQMLKELTKQ